MEREPTTQINTTIRVSEYNKYKEIGLPWNRLIRMGVASLDKNNQVENNKRLEALEKAYTELRTKYFAIRRKVDEDAN